MSNGTSDKVSGKFDQVSGKVKETVGKETNDQQTMREGQREQV